MIESKPGMVDIVGLQLVCCFDGTSNSCGA